MGCEQCKPLNSEATEKTEVVPVSSKEHDSDLSVPSNGTSQFLSKVELFKRLPECDQNILASAAVHMDFPCGQVIIRQGDIGQDFYVIKTGECSVSITGDTGPPSKVARLMSGDYMGELALLRDEPRCATITAETQVAALKITRDKFQDLGLHEKLVFEKRLAVGGQKAAVVPQEGATTKSAAEKQLMSDAIKKNANLSTMVTLTDVRISRMVDAAWKETVPAGKEVIKEGDLEADYFYIVNDGQFEITVSGKNEAQNAETAIAKSKMVRTVTKGGSFGELALLYFTARAATVKAKVASTLWVIDRSNFKSILAKSADEVAQEHLKYIEKVEILSVLKDEEKKTLATSLSEMTFTKNETVIEQGTQGDVFYILYAGEVSVMKDGKEVARLKATPDMAQVFGERALMSQDVRSATVKVLSDTCSALTLDRDSFNILLGSLEDLKIRGKEGTTVVPKSDVAKTLAKSGEASAPQRGKIFLKDLKKLGLLGCGGFGAVELVEHSVSGDTYALKALSKGYVVKSGMKESVKSEKNVQIMCDSVFVVKLYETYNGTQSLYLLLELALGGELYATYNRKGFYGQEKHARYYVSGTLFAFEHLHARKIIFRDLKPENLLLNEKGFVKLTDMGLAKVCVGKTYTTCGTPDYFAPELIESAGHNQAVDWWTLGILTFELMSGHPPFESPNPMQTYQKIKRGIAKVTFPSKTRGACEDMVRGLLKKDPTERLPMKKGGTANLKAHKWFKDYDWDAREKLTMEPPYKPQVKSKKDIANFNARKEDMPPQVPYKDDGTGWDKDFATST